MRYVSSQEGSSFPPPYILYTREPRFFSQLLEQLGSIQPAIQPNYATNPNNAIFLFGGGEEIPQKIAIHLYGLMPPKKWDFWVWYPKNDGDFENVQAGAPYKWVYNSPYRWVYKPTFKGL